MSDLSPDQISTKEFFKSIFDYFKFIFSKWQIILIFLLIGTAYDLIKNSIFEIEKKYGGIITFHLELDSGGGGVGQFAGLASTFGLGGGSGAKGGDLLGMANFEAIMLSVNVFQNAFMKEVTVNGKKELFINYYIDSSNIKRKEWAPTLFRAESPFAKYKFVKKNIMDFTPLENQIISDIYNKLAEETLVEPVEKSSLFQLNANTTNEMLTKVWMETLLDATEDFYKKMKTKKTRQLLEVQQERLDSLTYLLKNTDRKLARVTFDNPNVVDPNGVMRQQQLTRDNSYMTTQYYTQMANVENLNRMIFEQTPIFTILEPVRLPLSYYKKVGISTRISGLILMVVSILGLSLYRTYLKVFDEA
jgi:hypothetical protein